MGDSMTVSLSTDNEGFLSQECPSCKRRFKAKMGEGSDQPVSFCPYCGHAGRKCWWTSEQVNYFAAVAGTAVLGPQLDAMARDFNSRAGGRRGFLNMSMSVSNSPVPTKPSEQDEGWPKVKFECCNGVIKYEPGSDRLHCIICGLEASLTPAPTPFAALR